MDTGQRIGRYVLSEKVGKGGMAEIFRAEETLPEGGKRIVAIKRLFPKLSADREFVGMFVNEALIASNMDHFNIIKTYDLLNFGSYYYIVMEYLEGQDLEELVILKDPTGMLLSIAEIGYVIHEVAMGLDYAHNDTNRSLGGSVVHRDISPGNILIGCQGSVKITDFGIARATQYASFTRPGVLKGKYEYMAPEYVKGEEFDGRADLFSLGVVLYELLTGDNPFLGVTPQATWDALLKQEAPPPSSTNPGLTKAVDQAVARALAKDPRKRFQSGEEFADSMQKLFVNEGRQEISAALGVRVKKSMKTGFQVETTLHDIEEFMPPDEGQGDSTREVYLDEMLELIDPVDVPQPQLDIDDSVEYETMTGEIPGEVTAPRIPRPSVADIHPPRKRNKLFWMIPCALVLMVGLAWLLWPAETGYLYVTSNRRAEVFVDGQRKGLAPIDKLPLQLGWHTIEVRRPGRKKTKKFRRELTEEGQEISLRVKWKRKSRVRKPEKRKPSTKKKPSAKGKIAKPGKKPTKTKRKPVKKRKKR